MSFADIISKGLSTIAAISGETVTYHRGDDWTELVANVGKTDFLLDDGNGVAVEYQSRDYLLASCDLVLDGEEVEPQRGDLVKETSDGKQHVYEVMRPDGNEQVWKHSDCGRRFMRIHTKLREVVLV